MHTPDGGPVLQRLNLLRTAHLQLASKLDEGLKLRGRYADNHLTPRQRVVHPCCLKPLHLINELIDDIPEPLVGQLNSNGLLTVCCGRSMAYQTLPPPPPPPPSNPPGSLLRSRPNRSS